MAAKDQPLAVAARFLTIIVEMDAGVILGDPSRHHMFGLGDGTAIDMINLLADLVILPEKLRAAENGIIFREIEAIGHHERVGRDHGGKIRNDRFRRGCIEILLVDHHPAHIVDRDFLALIVARGADIDDAGLAVRILLEPDHLGDRIDGVSGIEGLQKPAIRIAEIGHRIDRDVRHGLAEDDVERADIIHRRARKAAAASELVGGLKGEARAVKRVVNGHVARGDRAGCGVQDFLTDMETVEEIAFGRLRFRFGAGQETASPVRAAIASAMATSRRAFAT